MTILLEQAMEKLRTLAPDAQDAIAARLLEELEAELAWEANFANTTPEQWERLAATVRSEIAAGEVVPLENLLAELPGE